jgi:hypothetical protein
MGEQGVALIIGRGVSGLAQEECALFGIFCSSACVTFDAYRVRLGRVAAGTHRP